MNLNETIKRIVREELLNESDPKTGTGKKPKGSDRRLYTDENPSDTVSVKFKTKEDIVDTLNKESFKSKPHKRQSQIINLIHQRVRAAYQNAKDPETKKRLKRGLDYITNEKEKSKEKTVKLQKQEQTESVELTERCWKGYTQKGMKTMFGKKYPNCVKIKKKKSLKESIKNILDEEVQRKYPKPTEKVDKLVYNWLDNYFEGLKMYYNKSYESTHSFEWCNNGIEICKLLLHFNNDDNVYDDKRPMSERQLESATLYIPKDVINDLSEDIPVRRNYLRYLIEEWFEDNLLSVVQQKTGRNDIYVTEFAEHPDKSIFCVPPVEKPENVSMDDMIEYVLANTLFSREKLFKYEEEQPGYVEKTYLNKLRQKEHERLNG